jgi:uridine kinase
MSEAAPGGGSVCRDDAIGEVSDAIASVVLPHPLRVAVDGVGAAGKTVLADELARVIARTGRQVIRAGIDGFHNPREVRYRRGPDSPEGYYLDSFDHEAVLSCIATPLGPGGDRRYRKAVYDFRTESKIDESPRTASSDAVLLFDGVFLLRPELRSAWDFSVFVDTSFPVALERALVRDLAFFGDAESVRRRYETRYMPGETMYIEGVRPGALADVVFGNDDPGRPVVRWNR